MLPALDLRRVHGELDACPASLSLDFQVRVVVAPSFLCRPVVLPDFVHVSDLASTICQFAH